MARRVVAIISLCLMLAGCGDSRVERAGSGAVIGGTVGFAVGAVCCMNPPAAIPAGTAIGAAAGGAVGALLSEPLFFNHEAEYWPYDMKHD